MATARIASGALLATVTDTAKTVSGIVNTVAGTFDMANNFISHHRDQQIKRYKLEAIDSETRMIEQMAIETAQRKAEIAKTREDPALKGYYNEAYARLEAALKPEPA